MSHYRFCSRKHISTNYSKTIEQSHWTQELSEVGKATLTPVLSSCQTGRLRDQDIFFAWGYLIYFRISWQIDGYGLLSEGTILPLSNVTGEGSKPDNIIVAIWRAGVLGKQCHPTKCLLIKKCCAYKQRDRIIYHQLTSTLWFITIIPFYIFTSPPRRTL